MPNWDGCARKSGMFALSLVALSTYARAEAPEFQLRLGTGSAQSEQAAQAALFTAFFGESFDSGSDVPLFGETSDGTTGARNLGQGQEIAAEISWRVFDTLNNWSLHAGVLGSYGLRRYKLPEGIGVFTDPVTISLRYLSLGSSAEARKTWDVLNGRTADLRFGLGAQRTHFRAHLSSDLLDVDAEDFEDLGFLRVSSHLDLFSNQPRSPALRAGITAWSNKAIDVSYGIAIGF